MDEGGLVLGARIEQEARAGLDHRAEAKGIEAMAQGQGVGLPTIGERIEVMVVQRERDAAVAGVGHHIERVTEAMAATPVRVVGEAQAHDAATSA